MTGQTGGGNSSAWVRGGAAVAQGGARRDRERTGDRGSEDGRGRLLLPKADWRRVDTTRVRRSFGWYGRFGLLQETRHRPDLLCQDSNDLAVRGWWSAPWAR